MKYEEFKSIFNDLMEQIQDYKDDNIESDKIMKYIKKYFKEFPDNIKYHCIIHIHYVKKCIEYIEKRVEYYTNKISFDEIMIKLQTLKMVITDDMNIIYTDLLDFMIDNEIIYDLFCKYYSPIESIDPTTAPIIFQEFRDNQKDAFKYLEENGLDTSIHCQATGCGKTYIILRYIDYTFKKFNNDTKIILFTERVNILKDLFDFSKDNHKANLNKITKWKELGIADLTNINIVNCVTRKDKDWANNIDSDKPTVIVINRAYLTLNKKNYEKFNNIKLVLHDECHNTSSEKCHEFLKKCKKINIPIVGFSATPLRTGKNDKEKLLEIYGKNNKLSLATNYNMIFAISKQLILPPEFYWYQINKEHLDKLNDKRDKMNYEYDTVATILDGLVKKLPNKKIVAWCGRIDLAKDWKDMFIDNHKKKMNLIDFNFYLDTSKTSDTEYEEFKKSDGKCILFCANKHREGSDISRLDACIFLDGVKDRGCIPFIQSIGRVLRKDMTNENKTKGIVIDGIYKTENYEKEFVDKILGYYMSLQNLSDENKTNYEKYIELKDIINFDKDKELISLNLNGNIININMNKLHWEGIINKFDSILQNKIKLGADDNMMDKGKILVETFGFNIRTDFYNEYKNINNDDRIKYNLPDINSEDYMRLFNGKSWFDFLGLKHDYYNSPIEAKLNLGNIIINNFDEEWCKVCETDNKLPPYPNYVWNGFYMDAFKNISKKLK